MELRLDCDQTVVILDNGIRGREAETAAFRLCCEIRIEDLFQVLLRNANTLVPQSNADVIARRKIRHTIRPVCRATKVVTRDVKRAALGHCLFGVDDEVCDHLAYLTRIEFGGPKV